MTPGEFVAGIKSAVFDSAVTGTMTHLEEGPAGREPHPRARALGGWFSQLAAGDQQMVAECVRDAAHAAVFGFLCVLDGARVIDDPPACRPSADGDQPGRRYLDSRVQY